LISELRAGDVVRFSGSPIRLRSNAEIEVTDERSVELEPESLDFVQAAGMPLRYITAYDALVERPNIKEGEKARGLMRGAIELY